MKSPTVSKSVGVKKPDILSVEKLEKASSDALIAEESYERMLFKDMTLVGTDAEDASFSECFFDHVQLSDAQLIASRFVDSRIDHVNASNANLEKCVLRRVEVISSKLTGVSMSEGTLEHVRFENTKADFLLLGFGKCSHVTFDTCNLTDADFQGCHLSNVTFANCDLSNVDMSHAKIEKVDVRGSVISGLRIAPEQLRGLIIEPSQAIYFVGLLGATIIWEGEQAN